MHRFGHILYVERRPRACGRSLSCALDLVRAYGARLTVAGFSCSRHDVPGPADHRPGADLLRGTRTSRCRSRLESLIADEGGGDLPVTVRVLEGLVHEAILTAAERERADLVMLVRDDPPVSPWISDAPDRRLLRESRCPVWILDPAQGPGLRSVLAAVDVADGVALERNRRILAVAASVAARTGARLRVLHAWTLLGEPILASSVTGVGRDRLGGLLARTREERLRRVRRLVDLEGTHDDVELELRKGEAARLVRGVARQTEADLVVLGSSGRSGLSRLISRTLAERVLGRVPGSLLVLRGAFENGADGGADAGVDGRARGLSEAGERS